MFEWIKSLFKSEPETPEPWIPPSPRNGMRFIRGRNTQLYMHIKEHEPELESKLEQSSSRLQILALLNEYTGLNEHKDTSIRESMQRFHAALIAKQNDKESANEGWGLG